MLPLLATLLLTRQTFAADLEHRLKTLPMHGVGFHRAIITEAKRHGLFLEDNRNLFRTFGNRSGVLVWLGKYYGRELYFIWREGHRNFVQQLPADDAWYLVCPTLYRRNELILCGDAYAGGNWFQPVIWVYRKHAGKWAIVQKKMVGSESGHFRTGFSLLHGKVFSDRIVISTRPYPAHLDAPHGGPHLEVLSYWRYQRGRYVLSRRVRRKTAVAALDDLAALAKSNRRHQFNERVPKRFRHSLWKVLRNGTGLNGPLLNSVTNVTDDFANELLLDQRYEIAFKRRRGEYFVSSMR